MLLPADGCHSQLQVTVVHNSKYLLLTSHSSAGSLQRMHDSCKLMVQPPPPQTTRALYSRPLWHWSPSPTL
jgi:hypothetical protein